MKIESSYNWLCTSQHYLGEIPSRVKQIIANIVVRPYDWVVGIESEFGMVHVHLALSYQSRVTHQWLHTLLPDWDIRPVDDINDWNSVVSYARKDGEYVWHREHIPELYANPNPVWRPWQQAVLDAVKENAARKVICVVDSTGNTGKTFLAMWHVVRNRAVYCPVQQYRDIMRQVYARPTKWMYIFDLPRALTGRQMNHIFAACETIRNGYAYDDRYEWKERCWNPVPVIVYTNNVPKAGMLSEDRWLFIYPEIYKDIRGDRNGSLLPQSSLPQSWHPPDSSASLLRLLSNY